MIIDRSFKWPVAGDYEIEDGDPTPIEGEGERRARIRVWRKTGMFPPRGGAGNTIAGGAATPGPRLVAKGSLSHWAWPFKLGPGVGQRLLQDCERWGLEDGVVRFAKRYGMLTQHPGSHDEPLSMWKGLVKSLTDGSHAKATRIGFQYLRRTRTGEVALVPYTLMSAIECEAFLLGWGAELKQCPGCGAMFEVGGKSGKHAHAEFCSDPCRYSFHNRVKAKFIASYRNEGFTAPEAAAMWKRTKR